LTDAYFFFYFTMTAVDCFLMSELDSDEAAWELQPCEKGFVAFWLK